MGLAVLAWWGSPESYGLSLSQLEQIAGTGTNTAGIILCWDDGQSPSCLGWGMRWNGGSTIQDLWNTVTNADFGLTGSVLESPAWAAYHRPTRAGDLLPRLSGETSIRTAYATDHFTVTGGTWQAWITTGSDYRVGSAEPFDSLLPGDQLLPDSWILWVQSTGAIARTPGYPLPAVHYPFASSVVAYQVGDAIPPFDWMNGEDFTNRTTLLGRPTVDTTGDDDIPTNHPVPVTVCYPAFRAHEVATVTSNGVVILAFDHTVLDHPMNPYGIDLILFGNSLSSLAANQTWTNGPPQEAILAGSSTGESALLDVSVDGTNWVALPGLLQLDGFAPTTGRELDATTPDPALGPDNLWWGGPSDPTLPVNPALDPDDWAGYSVAGITACYRGSAGGYGVDLSSLDLPADPLTGIKGFRYLRIRSFDQQPEIDAVADVSPAFPYDLWQLDHFPWLSDPVEALEASDPDVDGDANLIEYAGNHDPLQYDPTPAWRPQVDPGAGELIYQSVPAPDLRLGFQSVAEPVHPDWLDLAPFLIEFLPGSVRYHLATTGSYRMVRMQAVRHD